MNGKIVILGVGNWLLSDDGVGVHVAQELAFAPPPDVEVVDAGTDVLSALPFLELANRVLIVDAVRAGGNPGSISELAEDDLAAQTAGPTSLHAVNILAGRHLLPPGTAWPSITILGVEPATLDYGLSLSPAVAAALPQVVRRCREIVAAWQTGFPNPEIGRSE